MAKGAGSPAARKALAKRVDDLLSEHDLASLERGVSAEIADELWQAVERDAVFVDDDISLCIALTHAPMDAARATMLVEHLARATPESAHLAVLPCWSVRLDALVHRAYEASPEPFETRAARLPTWARHGLALVQRRQGKQVPAEIAREVALGLASSFPCGGPFGWTFRYLDEGRETSITVAGVDELRRFATIVDAETAESVAWSEALARSVDENRWHTITSIAPVLRELPLQRLVEQLGARHSPSDEQRLADRSVIGGRTPEFSMAEAVSLLETRDDRPEDLVAQAEHLTNAHGGRAATTLLAVFAAARGAPVIERLVSLDVVADHRLLAEMLIRAARGLPVDAVRRWAERAIPKSSAGVVLLGAHFDRGLFEQALREGPSPSPRAIGFVGAPALAPVLEAISGKARDEERQARIRHGLVFLLDDLRRAGTPPSEELDLELLVAAFDGRPLERAEYRHTMQAATERLVGAMPLERRRAILHEARSTAPMSVSAMLPSIESDGELDEYLAYAIQRGYVNSWIFELLGSRAIGPLLRHASSSTQMPWVHDEAKRGLPSDIYAKVAGAFVPGSKWRLVEADFERALAAMPDVPRTRVYLVEPASMAYSAREGSRSRLGGPAYGVAKADVPEDMDGQPQRHVFTLDLADVPELAARHPGIEAIALFCPGLEGNAEDATWIEIPRLPAARGRAAANATALAVRGFDVPNTVFTAPDHELGTEALAVLDRIHHAGAHIFGRPFFIHATGGSDGFLMQVNNALAVDQYAFDSLYLFDDGEVVAETL
ncbi:MAG: hypothetical protein HOW73_29485 [Polyangiaceae bacterium]|nr:hypothetical protein [Polyangiaceae bacterium]